MQSNNRLVHFGFTNTSSRFKKWSYIDHPAMPQKCSHALLHVPLAQLLRPALTHHPHAGGVCRGLKEVTCLGCTSEGNPISTLLTPALLAEALETHRCGARCHGMCWDCASQRWLQQPARSLQSCLPSSTEPQRSTGVCSARDTDQLGRRCNWVHSLSRWSTGKMQF